MLGDTAVAVHPDDERYRHLIGKEVELPLTGRSIPIIADDYVDPEFGTGCVKITPAHDFNDYEVGLRHELPMISIFDANARDSTTTRRRHIAASTASSRASACSPISRRGGLVERITDHTSMMPRGDRSGVVVEPMLTDQWYVEREAARQAGHRGRRARPHPVRAGELAKTYFDWMHNIQDWCISRQLWWGHRIPAWYDETGNVYVARDEAEARHKHGLAASVQLRQDDGRARHVVLVGALAVLDAGLARRDARARARSTPPTCSSRAATSSSSGSRG